MCVISVLQKGFWGLGREMGVWMCGKLVCTVYRGMTTWKVGRSDEDEEGELEMEWSKEKTYNL